METKDYKIGICCFSSKHAVWRRKSKVWLARNQDNVSQWGDMSTHRLLFQWSSTIKIQLSVLVWYKADLIVISLKINFFSPWYRWKIVEMALNNNHSLASDVQFFFLFQIDRQKLKKAVKVVLFNGFCVSFFITGWCLSHEMAGLCIQWWNANISVGTNRTNDL